MIELKNLEVFYKDFKALSILETIRIQQGEKVGIIGSNGAGKTTLIKAILGLAYYEGMIQLDVLQESIAIHMQQNEYSSIVSVKVVMEAILGCSLKQHKVANELIDYFDFRGCLHKKFKHLSGGQKQRLTLILVMCQNAPITIFDEVTSGLDFETRQRLMEKVSEYYRDRQQTVLLVSHYYQELEYLVDKILILEKGQFVDYGDKETLFKKYCGNTVYIMNRQKELSFLKGFKEIVAPDHLVAISCSNQEEELALTKLLVEHNVDYKRSISDIEIMSLNAKHVAFNKEVKA
ncbi:ABC transporter ATP-binding protein [Erysipelotrichaceae bacterium OH741_COT-311]|nr:ABC transporter ATP-binding protein [Erysipelotrichaceae bacterium OH741_COT-311]